MSEAVIKGMIKASMMKEALASYQIEGIGKDITMSDLYIAELQGKKALITQEGLRDEGGKGE